MASATRKSACANAGSVHDPCRRFRQAHSDGLTSEHGFAVARPLAAHLPCSRASRRLETLRPFHDARADVQYLSHKAHALASLNPRNSPLAQIHRIGSCHLPKASDSNTTFESETWPSGNRRRFSYISSRSRRRRSIRAFASPRSLPRSCS
jgi:hypothetical protein